MNTLNPCSYCGNTSFNCVPNLALDIGHMTTVLGIQARQHKKGDWWTFTLVSCTKCGNTLIFTTNPQFLAQRFAGATIVQAAAR